MKTKTFTPGDRVSLKTKSKSWEGYALESHDPEIILLKLSTGYNIGIRESEILDAKVIEKSKPTTPISQSKIENAKLPKIAIIITGGTISSRLDPKSGGTIPTDKEAILTIAPELKKICNPIIESPFMKFSEDMSYSDWKTIAEICEKYLNDKEVSGIIITHGTDFLHYTASALSFFIRDLNKPIALTYSQRSIDRASTDASLNLICSAKYAISDIAEIALIGHENQNDLSCLAMPATKVRKMHTSRRDTFQIINDTPIARITPDKIEFLKTFNARSNSIEPAPTNNKNKSVRVPKIDTKFQEKVALIKIHPGQNPDILEFYQSQDYKGIVLEIAGIGQVPGRNAKYNWLPKIKKAIDSGMIMCATAQTINGKLNPNVYSAGRELEKTGIIFLEDMLSETALIKLSWVLGHKQWNKKEKMLENISNEFNNKTII